MVIEWPEVALENVADEITVGYVGSMTSEYVEAGIPFLRSKNIESLRVNTEDLKFVSPEFHHKIRKSRLSPGDVVIVRTGKPGSCSVIPSWLEDANCSDLVIVRCGKGLNNRFLAYYVNTAASAHISAHLVGAVQQHFNVGSARSMIIRLPPLPEQKAIAHVLGALDDRIELNRRMNETLEAMAQALFKSWFVDFDPVIDNALAGGKEIPAELSKRAAARAALGDKRQPLPAEIRTLFSDEFTASAELGWIPKGWEVGVVKDLGEVICGKTPPTKDQENYGEDIPFITIPDMHGATYVTSTARQLSTKGADTQIKKYLPANTVCVSCIATSGLVILASEVSQTNQQINSVVPQNPKAVFFIYESLSRLGEQIRAAGSGGSVFSNLSKGRFEKLPILLPAQAIQEAFQQVVEPNFTKLLASRKNSSELSKLRDTLLPKLLSGEVRIPEAEKMVEELSL